MKTDYDPLTDYCTEEINVGMGQWDRGSLVVRSLKCEKMFHKPDLANEDMSHHSAWFNGYQYKWGGGDKLDPTRLDHPYTHTLESDQDGYYWLGVLNSRDIGKWIEVDEGATSVAGKLIDVRHFVDEKYRKKMLRRNKIANDMDCGRTEFTVKRNGVFATRTMKVTDKFRMYFTQYGRL